MSGSVIFAVIFEILVFGPIYFIGACWTGSVRSRNGDHKFNRKVDWLWPLTIVTRMADFLTYGWMKCPKCQHVLHKHVYSVQNSIRAHVNRYEPGKSTCHGLHEVVRPNAEGYNYHLTGPCRCTLDQQMIKLNQDKHESSLPNVGSSKVLIGSEHDRGG